MSEVNETKPVYASVVFKVGRQEVTVEGWVNRAAITDVNGNEISFDAISIQPSLEYIPGGYEAVAMLHEVISITPAQPVTAYNTPLNFDGLLNTIPASAEELPTDDLRGLF